MPSTFGSPTTSIIKNEFNGLHLEFEVGATNIKIGQPVKLDATGKVVPLAANDNQALMIGHSIHNGTGGQTPASKVTVAMKARAVVNALSNAALNPGPVKYASTDATTGKVKYATLGVSEEALTVGFALEVAAGANEEILVAVV